MTIVRIVQLVIWVLIALYLLLLNGMNRQINLPFLLPLSAGWAMLIAVALGWLVAWIPARGQIFRLRRQSAKLERQLTKIQEDSAKALNKASTPVIPDRKPTLAQRLRPNKAEETETPS